MCVCRAFVREVDYDSMVARSVLSGVRGGASCGGWGREEAAVDCGGGRRRR